VPKRLKVKEYLVKAKHRRRQDRLPMGRPHTPSLYTSCSNDFFFYLFTPSLFTPSLSSVVNCLWEVFVWGFGVLFLSCVCVGVGSVVLCRCVCVCDLLIF